MIPDFNPTTASTITISVGTLGVLANILALYAIRRNSAFSNAFGTLCQSHAVANIGVCAAFSVLTGGVTLLHPTWHSTYWGRRSGQLIFFFWEGSLFTHLFAAIDRATVINFPSRYSRIFGGGTVTKVILLVVWAIATAQSFPYFITSCSMTFDVTRFTYHHGEGLCGHITEHYTDFAVSFTTVIIIWMLDMSSLFRLIQLRENAPFRQTKRRHEIQLFFQSFTQSSLLMTSLASSYLLSALDHQNKWYFFSTTTLSSLFAHTLDGIVVIVFSKEIRRKISGRLSMYSVATLSRRKSSIFSTGVFPTYWY
ncbi:hypothetical protein QR680_015886 [Steinernema hermaphroditum]|uniref:G-protein coupled receptors family 1 profile domain-containing protein n=1 Tax=Steinernema hermaphroditum TaxID=289476 RepID=A0AA39LLN1_9BILA|nr:hypothetical protein QR680_015886 [Steinernema hermaphroditum]